MKLFFTSGWDGSRQRVSEKATEEDISAVINSLDWSGFNSVTLEKDLKNWIDINGNLASDGLAIVFEENGVRYISDNAPETIKELESALKLFLKNDQEFKRFGFISSQEPKKSISEEDLRKVRFRAKENFEKRRLWFNAVVAIILVGIGSIIYLWIVDELGFLGYETDYTNAVITERNVRYLKGGLVNIVAYEFDFADSVYLGHFRETTTTGSYKKGDVIKVKFAVDAPSRSKRVARLVTKSSLKKED